MKDETHITAAEISLDHAYAEYTRRYLEAKFHTPGGVLSNHDKACLIASAARRNRVNANDLAEMVAAQTSAQK